MIEAFVLIQTEIGKPLSVATQVGQVHGVATAVVVTGPYDVIARVTVRSLCPGPSLDSAWTPASGELPRVSTPCRPRTQRGEAGTRSAYVNPSRSTTAPRANRIGSSNSGPA